MEGMAILASACLPFFVASNHTGTNAMRIGRIPKLANQYCQNSLLPWHHPHFTWIIPAFPKPATSLRRRVAMGIESRMSLIVSFLLGPVMAQMPSMAERKMNVWMWNSGIVV